MTEAVLEPSYYTDAADDTPQETVEDVREPIRWGRFTIFLALLPWFGSTFSYVKDIRPFWAFAKAFPVISLPLVVVLMFRQRVPFTRQLLLTLVYMILVPSFTGMFSFHQDFFTGLTSQVKLLPLIYFFSMLATMYLLELNFREVQAGFLAWAALTYVVLIAIWLFAPHSWYATKFIAGQASILTTDNRGYRIRMPMYFGIFGIFYCFRRFYANYNWFFFALAGFGFYLLIGAVKTRAYIVAAAALLAFSALRFSKPVVKLALAVILPIAFLALSQLPLVASLMKNEDPVRETTVGKIVDFLGTSVTNWAIGVGSISPLDPSGMIVFFNHFFFLADVTWMGVIFEFGLIGAALFVLIPLRGIWMSRKLTTRKEDAFLGSLHDYLIYAIVTSPMTAIILAPGELTVIIAVFVYFYDRLHLKEV